MQIYITISIRGQVNIITVFNHIAYVFYSFNFSTTLIFTDTSLQYMAKRAVVDPAAGWGGGQGDKKT